MNQELIQQIKTELIDKLIEEMDNFVFDGNQQELSMPEGEPEVSLEVEVEGEMNPEYESMPEEEGMEYEQSPLEDISDEEVIKKFSGFTKGTR